MHSGSIKPVDTGFIERFSNWKKIIQNFSPLRLCVIRIVVYPNSRPYAVFVRNYTFFFSSLILYRYNVRTTMAYTIFYYSRRLCGVRHDIVVHVICGKPQNHLNISITTSLRVVKLFVTKRVLRLTCNPELIGSLTPRIAW